MDLNDYFQLIPIPSNALAGSYNSYLVGLSYLIATFASYVALDITERIRAGGETIGSKILWLICGALAMGMGIWTMHFIGMLAFIMPHPMSYEPLLTGLSMAVAIIASGFAFYLIINEQVKTMPLMMGGILMGLGIVSMHYMGMSAMENVKIRYLPSFFFLSIGIAVLASEIALWLMIKGSQIGKKWLKIGSAFVMGFAICGMHYTGMEAAVITHVPSGVAPIVTVLNPGSLSIYIALTTLVILSISLAASRFWLHSLQTRNRKLMETEAILEQKSIELQELNQNLITLVETTKANEEKIRAILTAAADGIIVINEDGVIELCNRAGSEIFGYSGSEILYKNITEFIGKKNQEREKKFHPLPFPSLIEKLDALVELTSLSKSKTTAPIDLSISRLILNNKFLYIIVFRDITERKLAEKNMIALNQKLVSTARIAGMAEVAASVLHNVGNVLNSVNLSAQILLERNQYSQIQGLIRVANLLNTHQNDLVEFFKEDPIGRSLPEYFKEFAAYWNNEQAFLKQELESLNSKILHIKNIVNMQQSLKASSSLIEKIQINDLIEDALAINSELMGKYGILIERDFAENLFFEIDKVKILQILINLIKNAMEALIESDRKEKKITLSTKDVDQNFIQIEISDNGVGIGPENILKIFSYGFTTKKEGHGFGLHVSALSAQEAGGYLKAYSKGLNQGSTFILKLPKKMNEK
ncbi:MAG: PAS domain S-box protein [Candidatus Protochlamydia sp.]|nr:PAS domain S-box protein [Candidatus Protochlamydia sp.]